MGLSSNSIVHFTETKDALKGILSDNFRVKYCREKFPLQENPLVTHVPMVSFCDIPFSQIKRHVESYGNYGIGLTRDWAVKMRLNPVLYIQQGSLFSESYIKAIQYFIAIAKNRKDIDRQYHAENSFLDVIRYAKPYQGRLERKGKKAIDPYRFSDEREWRYVPAPEEDCEFFYFDDEFEEEAVKSIAREKMEKIRLYFEPSDIKYIIIKDDSEIREFLSHLRGAKSKYSYEDVEVLMTRIITADQIKTDF